MDEDPKKDKYWFRAKRYGYGWGLPTKWQGWVTIGAYLIAILAPLPLLATVGEDDSDRVGLIFLAYAAVVITVFLKVVSSHGPPAKWRWGKKDDTDL